MSSLTLTIVNKAPSALSHGVALASHGHVAAYPRPPLVAAGGSGSCTIASDFGSTIGTISYDYNGIPISVLVSNTPVGIATVRIVTAPPAVRVAVSAPPTQTQHSSASITVEPF